MIKVRIKPTRELFFNEDSYYGIYGATVEGEDAKKYNVEMNQYGNISIKGTMPKLDIGREYYAVVVKETGSTFKGTYLLESIRQDRPTTLDEQKVFLKMILTEYQVENIFKVYEGQDVIKMIEEDTFDYSKVKGIGKATYENVKEKVLTSLELSELLVFLGKHGIKYNMVQKLIKKYQSPQLVIQKIEDNPYVLTEVRGIGFQSADNIAKAMGYDLKSPHRINSAIKFAIEEENTNGHSWMDRKQILNKTITLVNLNKKLIEECLDVEEPESFVRTEDGRFTVKAVYEAEKFIARKIKRMGQNTTPLLPKEEIDQFLHDYCEKNQVELEENQHQFFHDWNENKVPILVGGGGMGKSWLMNILLQMIDEKKAGFGITLLAPTGKASKVITGYTKREAMTIHRRVGVRGEDDEGNLIKKIEADVIVIDESSMCDIFILEKLFMAIVNPNARIMFVGDDFQLPSVGVGNFLYDILNSGVIKISRLKKVFRQSDGGILDIATKIRNGHIFLNKGDEGRVVFGKDMVCWLVDSEHIRSGVSTNYAKLMKNYSQEDVVVLTPTNKGALGTIELNKMIQKIVNPPSDEKKEKAIGKKDSPIYYRVGDRVMNTVNTYEIEMVNGGFADVFNGDTGRIIDIDEKDKCLIIDFEGIIVKMPFSSIMTNLIHSWAMTIHKSQGSQYKVVIVVADKSAKYQLNANLLYTGISRATNYVLLLSQAETIISSQNKFINMERRSFLMGMLQEDFDGKELDEAPEIQFDDEEVEAVDEFDILGKLEPEKEKLTAEDCIEIKADKGIEDEMEYYL